MFPMPIFAAYIRRIFLAKIVRIPDTASREADKNLPYGKIQQKPPVFDTDGFSICIAAVLCSLLKLFGDSRTSPKTSLPGGCFRTITSLFSNFRLCHQGLS